MRTWKAAIVSAPRRTNIPAMERNVNAMSSAAAVIRLSITTATPPAITPIDRRAKTTGSTKSNVTSSSAGRADRRRRGRTGSCAQSRKTPALNERDPGHENDDEQPVRDRDRHERVGERERERRHGHDVHEGHRNEAFPAEAHQLIDPETRQGGADPHHHDDERVDLEREPKNAKERDRVDARSLPTPEPERRDDRADHRHVAVLGKRQHRAPAHAGVLGEPADDERNRHEREDLRDLVRDELACGAETPDEGIFVVRRPPRDDDAEDGHRPERGQVQKSDVQVRADDVLGERQHGPRREHRTKHERRRRDEEPAIGRRRAHVLLRDELERVGEGLKQAEGPDVIRPESVLNDRLDLPFEIDLQEGAVQHEEQREADGDDQPERRPDERIEAKGTDRHDYPLSISGFARDALTAGRFRSSRAGAGAPGREATRSPLTFLSTARVATRREKRLSKGMPREALLEEDAAEIGMTVELDAEHVVCLALAPIRAFPYGCERRDVRVELRARGAQHDRDLRARTANERHRAELCSSVNSGVDGVEVATYARVVANERRDLDQSFAIDVEDEHVVQRRHASLLAEARGNVRPKARENE